MVEKNFNAAMEESLKEGFKSQVKARGFIIKNATSGAVCLWMSLPEYIQARLMSLANKGVTDESHYWQVLREAVVDMYASGLKPDQYQKIFAERPDPKIKKINDMFDQIDEEKRKIRPGKTGQSAG